MDIIKEIAKETGINTQSIKNTTALLDEGASVPFISRYRKEVTGNLSETEVRDIFEKYEFFKELEARKKFILETIEKQEKLTPELEEKIKLCVDKNELEDLYLPFKPKRRTKAQIARELGFEELALKILAQELKEGDKKKIVLAYKNEEKGIVEYDDIIKQTLYIVAEEINHSSELRKILREFYLNHAIIASSLKDAEIDTKGVYRDYYEYEEALKSIPSHRLLALNRGEKEGVLKREIKIDEEKIINIISKEIIKNQNTIFFEELKDAIELAYFAYLHPSLSTEVLNHYTSVAESVAIDVFEKNLSSLLLTAPAVNHTIMGIDPGLRTGSKIAIIDKTGKYITNTLIRTLTEKEREEAEKTILELIDKYNITLIAIGNGKGSKDVAKIVRTIMKKYDKRELYMTIVNESGASIYSASKEAVKEFPDLDVTVRGAISIARRTHDPLAEFVKIDPKSLGVGQYQHDVNQKELKRRLDAVVSTVVNNVGVDINSASIPLLSYVSGITTKTAKEIVAYRDEHGSFNERKELLKVKGIGPKAFEQCAGFLRIRNGKNILDNTAIHPEKYEIIENICKENNIELNDLIENPQLLSILKNEKYIKMLGEYTLNDIIEELKKPGRDIRKEFEPLPYSEIETIDDIAEGMILDGIITNITNFGLFVDLGIGISGLCHISEAGNEYIKDLNQKFSVSERKKFRVLSVDRERNRIALSLKNI